MVKSFDIDPEDGALNPGIQKILSSLKGQSIFKISLKPWEQNLKKEFPAIGRLRLSRRFPDKVRLEYRLRQPIAITASEAGETVGIDDEGVRFKPIGSYSNLPELVLVSTDSTASSVSFLKNWSGASLSGETGVSTAALRKVFVDDLGEISLYLEMPPASATRVVWGTYEPQTFSEKLSRLQAVWSDLKNKSLSAQYINLREVPRKSVSALGESEMVGRVFVRTSAEKTSEPKIKNGKI